MKTKFILIVVLFTTVIISIAADPSIFDPEIIKAIFIKSEKAKELSDSGKSIKAGKLYKEIENELSKTFTNGKIIQSDSNCSFIKGENTQGMESRGFGISCLEEDFFFVFESESDVHLSNKKALTKIAMVEKFEDIKEDYFFSGKLMIISRGDYPAYNNYVSSNPRSISVNVKILEINNIRAPEFGRFSAYQGGLNWRDAKEKCKSIGMRLPTLEELKAEYTSKKTKLWRKGDSFYWSSTPYNADSSYTFNIENGESSDDNNDNPLGFRCIR